MIYCFGDSLTEGKPGISFIKYLRKKHKCKNIGLGGDTVSGLISRIEDKWLDKITGSDYAIVGIGTNDILIPFFKDISGWDSVAKSLYRRGSVPCMDINEFTIKYNKLLAIIKTKTQNIIVFGLPIIETSSNDLDAKAAEYNKVIESACSDKNIPYIDIRQWQKQQQQGTSSEYFFISKQNTRYDTVIDVLTTTYLPFDEKVSQKRELQLTVDGCHFNSKSAKALAELIEKYIV